MGEAVPAGRMVDMLAGLTLGMILADDFPALTVLGWESVVEVISVSSSMLPGPGRSRRLDLDAENRGSGVIRVPLSTLRRPSSISFSTASAFFLLILFALAVFLRSAPVVAVKGGLGGARVGGLSVGSFSSGASPASVASGVKGDFAASSRE